jgi:hypothetical protein
MGVLRDPFVADHLRRLRLVGPASTDQPKLEWTPTLSGTA